MSNTGENTVAQNSPDTESQPPKIMEEPAVWNSETVLGSGAFGVVWRQREERTGELRAVKVISKSQSCTQELQTLVDLRDVSPHILYS